MTLIERIQDELAGDGHWRVTHELRGCGHFINHDALHATWFGMSNTAGMQQGLHLVISGWKLHEQFERDRATRWTRPLAEMGGQRWPPSSTLRLLYETEIPRAPKKPHLSRGMEVQTSIDRPQ